MIFASIYKGEYLIIEDNKVIGGIRRFKKQLKRGKDWTKDVYYLEWADKSKPMEKYFTLPEIQAAHMFENYPGYGRVLHKPAIVRLATAADRKAIQKYEKRYRSRYIPA